MRTFSTACGRNIIVPPKTEEHLLAHPEVEAVLSEAVSLVTLPDSGFMKAEVEMGRIVGRSGCVQTSANHAGDRMFFAQRIAREYPSRVAPQEILGPETTKVTVLAFPDSLEKRAYVLVTAWIGILAEREPWDQTIESAEEYAKSLDFWCTHALVYDPRVMGAVFQSSWKEILNATYSLSSLPSKAP